MTDVTRILDEINDGDPNAADKLLPLVYEELRKLAAHHLSNEKPGQTLQATALVHEAYIRLVGSNSNDGWSGRGHFFGAAAEAIRRILIEHARRKKGPKAGGDRARIELSQVEPLIFDSNQDLLVLNDGAYAKGWLQVALSESSGTQS